jgi:hypothetical protein
MTAFVDFVTGGSFPGMFLHECRQLWREGCRDYVLDWWNWMDSSLIFLYLSYYAVQIVVFVKVNSK